MEGEVREEGGSTDQTATGTRRGLRFTPSGVREISRHGPQPQGDNPHVDLRPLVLLDRCMRIVDVHLQGSNKGEGGHDSSVMDVEIHAAGNRTDAAI